MKRWPPVSLFLLLCLPLLAQSQAPTTEDPAQAELRALRDGVVAAIRKGDIEAELQFLHPNVVVTWQNAEVIRGREGVRTYLNRMRNGPEKMVDSYRAD